MNERLALIIPTKDRLDDLKRLLDSIGEQSMLLEQIVIVDSSREPQNALKEIYSQFHITYKHVSHPSLTAQRNTGIQLLEDSITLVCFLDDDMVFCPDAIKNMLNFWQTASWDVGGAVFNIINEKKPTAVVMLKNFFFTGTKERGVVLRSGFNTLVCPAEKTRFVQWIFGGGTVWRRPIFKEFLFDEWFDGDGFCEDLDFSYRVGEKYKLAVVAEAHVEHLSPPVNRRKTNFKFGISQIRNRFYFVRKHPELSVGMCLWGGCGQMLENIVRGFIGLNPGYFQRAAGNFLGFFKRLNK